jgi:hypothetical protein
MALFTIQTFNALSVFNLQGKPMILQYKMCATEFSIAAENASAEKDYYYGAAFMS